MEIKIIRQCKKTELKAPEMALLTDEKSNGSELSCRLEKSTRYPAKNGTENYCLFSKKNPIFK